MGIAATIYLILDRLDYLKSEAQLESVVSRESSFLFNNLILLASCFAVLWGTLFPVISEAISGDKISLDADWYNRLMVPIGTVRQCQPETRVGDDHALRPSERVRSFL